MANLKSSLTKWSPVIQSVMRIIIALLFIEHGTEKLFSFPVGIEGITISAFSLLWFAAVLEFLGGLLLLLGLFTRPAAFILAGEMASAYFIAHAPKSFWPIVNQGELAILYCFVFLYLAFAGGGKWSLDRALRKID